MKLGGKLRLFCFLCNMILCAKSIHRSDGCAVLFVFSFIKVKYAAMQTGRSSSLLPSTDSGCVHYGYVIMSAMTSQITSLKIVYSIVYSGADQRKHQSSASLAFVRGIHQSPVNSPHKGPLTRKMSPFDDVIMLWKFDGLQLMTVFSALVIQMRPW